MSVIGPVRYTTDVEIIDPDETKTIQQLNQTFDKVIETTAPPEAAAASIRFGFGALGLSEIVANTVPQNASSRRVMDKHGMSHDAEDDFDHPGIPEGHLLRRQVLYRLSRDRWMATKAV